MLGSIGICFIFTMFPRGDSDLRKSKYSSRKTWYFEAAKKHCENVVKTKVSEKPRYAANPMGPSGPPSAPRGSQSSAKAHVGNPWENKGKRMSLHVFQVTVGFPGSSITL